MVSYSKAALLTASAAAVDVTKIYALLCCTITHIHTELDKSLVSSFLQFLRRCDPLTQTETDRETDARTDVTKKNYVYFAQRSRRTDNEYMNTMCINYAVQPTGAVYVAPSYS